jgi:hypothetical protein
VFILGIYNMPPCGPRMDNSSVGSFTDTDELNVTNLLSLKITMQETLCQSTGRLACHPANPYHFGGQHCSNDKGNPIATSLSLTLLMDDWEAAFAHFPPNTTLPIQLGKDDAHLSHQTSNIHVYRNGWIT